MKVVVLLFDDFETLDVFGPVEVFGRLTDHYKIVFCSVHGGVIRNRHGLAYPTELLGSHKDADIFLIPGGYGTRPAVLDPVMIAAVRDMSAASQFVLTVCTGTSLLARTGLLDGRKATSNKIAFNWVKTNGPQVLWDARARWTVDGKYYTSSGVTAGIDMSLGFVAERQGIDVARRVAREIEYVWVEDRDNDPFVAEVG